MNESKTKVLPEGIFSRNEAHEEQTHTHSYTRIYALQIQTGWCLHGPRGEGRSINDLLRSTSVREEEGPTATDPAPQPPPFSYFFFAKTHVEFSFQFLQFLLCLISARRLSVLPLLFVQICLTLAKSLPVTSLSCTHTDRLKWSSNCLSSIVLYVDSCAYCALQLNGTQFVFWGWHERHNPLHPLLSTIWIYKTKNS